MGWRLGAAREQRWDAGGEAGATACSGGSLGNPQNRVPGLGFGCGLDGEVERDEGNPIRGLRGRGGDRRCTERPREKWGRGKRRAAERPHHHVVLREGLFDGGERRNDGAAAARGMGGNGGGGGRGC
jgi:hypothetical protein